MKYFKLVFSALMVALSFVTMADPTSQSTIQNPDGSFTFTQKISGNSTSPHYIAPSGYGFDEYSWFNEDYGWQHSFDLFNQSNYDNFQIQSATLLIRGWDVDSEPFHGESGEYDGLSVDGLPLDPGLLQGTNNTWSETQFNVPLSSISDDGLIDVYLDIDMNHNSRHWATTLDYSLLSITYIETSNLPPFQAELSFSPSAGVSVNDDLVVSATGPTPADPDGNAVNYQYRWYVDVGQGFFVDDTFAGKAEHTGNTVPASQTANGERWRCSVTPVDGNGLLGPATTVTWLTIGDSDNDGVMDNIDAFPNDPLRAFWSRTPVAGEYTLAYEDLWPQQGDFDLNDLVLHYSFERITDASNKVKQINFTAELVSRGASRANGFALSFAGVNASNVQSASISVAGASQSLTPEAGHNGEVVFVLVENLNSVMPSSGGFNFYNTQPGDIKTAVPVSFSFSFTNAVDSYLLASAPYNPFIFATFDRGTEVHLPNNAPTDLANTFMFGTQDDDSLPSSGRYYTTADNLPWALNITSRWKHPLEQVDVTLAYPQIKPWAESSGSTSRNWFTSPTATKCWQCQ